MTFRRYHELIALWDHHTVLWAHLWEVLTKSADEWTVKFSKRSENVPASNLMKAILVENCHATVSVGLELKETQEEY